MTCSTTVTRLLQSFQVSTALSWFFTSSLIYRQAADTHRWQQPTARDSSQHQVAA